MNDNYRQLNDYLIRAQGIGRKGLNIMCFIGMFIFGWLLAVVFEMLGKKKQGWFYVVPLIIILSASRQSDAMMLLAPVIYFTGWIHVNLVLSQYQAQARRRLDEINSLASPDDAQALLEKGLIQAKVLHQKQKAVFTLLDALELEGGTAPYLNQAGTVLFAEKRFEDAKKFFDKALSCTEDQALIRLIKINQNNTAKRIEKNK